MSEELKPCPFCGGDAKVGKFGDEAGCYAWVNCIKCGVQTKNFLINPGRSPELNKDWHKYTGYELEIIGTNQAIAAWNKRTNKPDEQ
jgi:hypothetical protein